MAGFRQKKGGKAGFETPIVDPLKVNGHYIFLSTDLTSRKKAPKTRHYTSPNQEIYVKAPVVEMFWLVLGISN